MVMHSAALANYLPFTSDSDKPSNFQGSPEFSRLAPTPVFDAFWSFAAERQATFYRRQSEAPPPWTADPILGAFKFTNVYRASDRVSQYLIRRVIYNGRQEPPEVIFRILLFKLFNKIETWELLQNRFGEITTSIFSLQDFDRVLSSAFDKGQKIYSGAYIMPSGARAFPSSRKHGSHLKLVELMLKDSLHKRITDANNLEQVFKVLRSYPMIGNFLAFQYAIDINYSEIIDFSESEFVMPGPGARSGLQKCFSALDRMAHEDVIRLVADLQEVEFERRGLRFQQLGDRRLQLIDIQNLFCEIDKYARVRFPQATSVSKRSKIKQRFRPNLSRIVYWYPPKWRINSNLNPSGPL
jgi:hypothetical protein